MVDSIFSSPAVIAQTIKISEKAVTLGTAMLVRESFFVAPPSAGPMQSDIMSEKKKGAHEKRSKTVPTAGQRHPCYPEAW